MVIRVGAEVRRASVALRGGGESVANDYEDNFGSLFQTDILRFGTHECRWRLVPGHRDQVERIQSEYAL